LISNAQTIGSWVESSQTVSILVALLGFWILDLSNNMVQGPCRALLVDIAPVQQQTKGGSFFSFMLGTGNLLGYFAGSLELEKYFPFLKTNVRVLFFLGIIVVTLCVLITVIFTHEVSKQIEPNQPQSSKNTFITIIKGILKMSSPMVRICAVQFFAWFAWFTFLLFITTWVGETIFHGDPSAPSHSPSLETFREGVRFGALGLTVFAAVTMVSSLVLPILAVPLGIKPVFFCLPVDICNLSLPTFVD